MNPMFYFLLALTAVLAATTNASEPVIDFNGNPIIGGSYYVVPALIAAEGGGLNLAPRGGFDEEECPLYVGQEDSKDNRGIPVKFSNWKSKVGFVPESERLNIEMDVNVNATICDKSTYWWASEGDSLFKSLWIKAGPKPGAGLDSVKSFFQIRKTLVVGVYDIAFCPFDNVCEAVDVFKMPGGGLRLVVYFGDAETFPVRFVKAN